MIYKAATWRLTGRRSSCRCKAIGSKVTLRFPLQLSASLSIHALAPGTVRDNQPLLLSLDDAVFANGVALADYAVSLYRAKGIQDVAQIVNSFSAKAINIHNLNANGSWVLIQTDREVSIEVDGIERF